MARNFGVPRQIDRHERNAGLADMACDFCDQAWHYQPGEVPLPRLMLCTLRGHAHETTDMIRGGARNRARALKSMTLSSIVPPHLRLYRLACTANCEPPAFGRQFLQSKVRNNGWPSARSYSATTRERLALRGCPFMMLWTAPPPARECHGCGRC